MAPNPLSGNPVTHVWKNFVHSHGKVKAGVWDCTVGSFDISAHPSYEMYTILESEAVVKQEDGSRISITPGDSFVIPKGMHTIWHVETYVKNIHLLFCG